ncbi:MAG: VTT domain-containing protein [Bacillota bacterium]|nr:VTT domain-containing protein [Bacillota bacterium]
MKNKWKYFIYIMLFIFFITALIIFSKSKYYSIFKDQESMKAYIVSFGRLSWLVYFIIHLLQVVVFFLPGEVIEIAGGYIFGVYFGSLLSVFGILAGSFIAYTLGNFFGVRFILKIIPKSSIEYFQNNFGSKSLYTAIFIAYLIPGMPKDALAYICGISGIKRRDFLTYSTLGRIPCIAVSSYFGERLGSGDIKMVIIITVIMTLLFILGMIKGDNMIRVITKKRIKSRK